MLRVMNTDGISKLVTKFYTDLYKAPVASNNEEEERFKTWRKLAGHSGIVVQLNKYLCKKTKMVNPS